jgi:tetratricopeptide (TPR) repeat protein
MIDPVTQVPNDGRNRLYLAVGWGVVFVVCVLAYWPGLGGPFMLDDFGSIAALGDRGGISDWETFKSFVFGGTAGPLGRPISLLSFLIDSNNWPTDPWPFKRTNLVIHLLTGALIGLLTARILRALQFDDGDAVWITLVATACWLLHPFLVSTTLYAVQRMAQLATLFVFAGLNAYLYGRSFLSSRPMKAYLLMSASIGGFTLLAMYSKENGILLPMLVGVIEITILASQRPRLARLNRYWAITFIIIPSAVVALYLFDRVLRDNFFDIVPPRHYSAYEGLLTQSRVLVDYLRHWYLPELYTSGVFQDHFLKSTGVLSPITTLLSIMFHLVVVSVSLLKRREWPLFAFAVLFFYAGHILESSVLNLELYFEHRNYTTAAFLLLPLIALLRRKADTRVFFVVAAFVLMSLAGFTRYSATVWETFPSIVEASARKAPRSARAQAQYATQLFNARRYEESMQVIDKAIENIPGDHPVLQVNRLIMQCQLGVLSKSEFNRVADLLSVAYYDARAIRLYTALTDSVVMGKCPEVSVADLREMYENMLQVAVNSDPRSLGHSQLQYFVGFASVYSGDSRLAVAAFKESLRSRPGASHAMLMAAHLATGGYYDEALTFSEIALSQLEVRQQGILNGKRVSKEDVLSFQAVVREDIEALKSGRQSATEDD